MACGLTPVEDKSKHIVVACGCEVPDEDGILDANHAAFEVSAAANTFAASGGIPNERNV